MKGHEVVVAIQEERLSRLKRQRVRAATGSLCIQYCLSAAGISARDLDLIVLATQSSSKSAEEDIHLNTLLNVDANRIPVLNIGHHFAHAASVFYTSGWEESAILVIDGMGSPEDDLSPSERKAVRHQVRDGYEHISIYAGSGGAIVPLEKHLVEDGQWLVFGKGRMPRFGTLGGMFSSVSHQVFQHPMDAGKVMGLAPYGKPLIAVEDFFTMTGGAFEFHDGVPSRFDGYRPWPHHRPEYEDLASSAQAALEAGIMELVTRVSRICDSPNLCYSGGVALNTVANTRISRAKVFDDVYIFPAAEDSGAAVGAAYVGAQQLVPSPTRRRVYRDAFGASYTDEEVERAIQSLPGLRISFSPDWLEETVDIICSDGIVGWFQGGAELGPRALGQRSIVCDPRHAENKDILNARVKRREPFRPFAPAILRERVHEWFEVPKPEADNPFMLRVYPFRAEVRHLVPAVVHVDGTGRLQTVHHSESPLLYRLIDAFYRRTGIPILLNTSLNVMGQPIVETPYDALLLVLASGLDGCVIGSRLIRKDQRDTSLLEFIPSVAAEFVTPRHVVDENGPSNRQSTVEYRIQTPWGTTARLFPSDCLPLLTEIDGIKTGRDILSAVQGNQASLTPARAEEVLFDLTRARVLQWRA
jgi:carbamoyltransferase